MLRLKPTRVDIWRLLRQTGFEMAVVAAGNSQNLKVELPESLPAVWGDEDRLRQVVLNLLINATKFTPEGGTIILRAGYQNTMLMVQVQDTGRGIPKDEQIKLFQRYHRQIGDLEYLSGIGLGLSLCKLLIEMHGGKIWSESEVGKGSIFSFSIPIATSDQEADSERAGVKEEEKP
jgi:signal transduction histidine kinase